MLRNSTEIKVIFFGKLREFHASGIYANTDSKLTEKFTVSVIPMQPYFKFSDKSASLSFSLIAIRKLFHLLLQS